MKYYTSLFVVAILALPSTFAAIRCGSEECNENTECCVGTGLLSRKQCKPLAQEGEICSMTSIGSTITRNCPCGPDLQCLFLRCRAVETTPSTPSTPEVTTPSTPPTPTSPEISTPEATSPETPTTPTPSTPEVTTTSTADPSANEV